VFSGHNSLSHYNKYLWKYSIAKNEWTIVTVANPSQTPVERRLGSMVGAGHKFYLFGGYNAEQGLLNDFYEFDTITHSFTKLIYDAGMPSARTKATMAYNGNNTIFIFGGVTDHEISNELWRYYIPYNGWKLLNVTNKPPARASTISGCTDRYFVIFSGYNNDFGPLNV
jgi:N-acetylneuraminic acid mutarotase